MHASNQQLFPLPCACQNLRRLTRIVTRIYDQEMRKADIEITQYGLLTALATIAGMIPLSLALGAGSQMLQPLAIAVIGGVLASMVLSLLVTPAVHFYLGPRE